MVEISIVDDDADQGQHENATLSNPQVVGRRESAVPSSRLVTAGRRGSVASNSRLVRARRRESAMILNPLVMRARRRVPAILRNPQLLRGGHETHARIRQSLVEGFWRGGSRRGASSILNPQPMGRPHLPIQIPSANTANPQLLLLSQNGAQIRQADRVGLESSRGARRSSSILNPQMPATNMANPQFLNQNNAEIRQVLRAAFESSLDQNDAEIRQRAAFENSRGASSILNPHMPAANTTNPHFLYQDDTEIRQILRAAAESSRGASLILNPQMPAASQNVAQIRQILRAALESSLRASAILNPQPTGGHDQ